MPFRFSKHEIDTVNDATEEVVKLNPPGLVMEAGSTVVRGIQGAHLLNTLLSRLARDARLLMPAIQLLGGDVYVHQYKVNFKHAFVGDIWPWHRDFEYWHRLDGIAKPELVSVMVALDEISEFNGPLFFIPGSHHIQEASDRAYPRHLTGDEVHKAFSADLPFQLTKEEVSALLLSSEIVAPKGPIGLTLFFAANVAHASLPNLTATSRRLLIITYNRTDNLPSNKARRPEYISARTFTPLKPLKRFTI